MKHIIFLAVVFFAAGYFSITAQEIVKEVEFDCKMSKDSKFAFEGFELLNSGGIRITSTIQSHAMPFIEGAISNKMSYFTGFIFYELDGNLENMKNVREMINLNSYKYKGQQKKYNVKEELVEIGNSEKDKKYEVLKQEYPKFLLTEKDAGKSTEYVMQADMKNNFSLQKTASPVEFNIYANALLKGKSSFEQISVEYPESDMKRIARDGSLKDDENGCFVEVTGLSYPKEIIKQDKTKKFNYFQDNELHFIDRNAKIKETYHKKFDYPKNILYKNFMTGSDGKINGYLYVFGYASGISKSLNDPEKDNNEFIYLSPEGKELATGKYKLTKDANYIYAFNRKDETILFVKGTGYKFGIIKANKTEGTENSIEWTDLEGKTVGEKSLSLRNSFEPGIVIHGHIILDDNSFILYGEKVNEVGPVGGDKSNEYNYIALHFDKDGTLITQYTCLKANEIAKVVSTKLNCVYTDQNDIFFISNEPTGVINAKPYNQFFAGEELEPVNKDNRSYHSMPVILKIDLNSKKISCKKVSSKNFTIANENSYYVFDKENRTLYFAGYNESSEALPLKIIVSKIQL